MNRLFEKYNPEADVKRAPNGRGPVKKLMDRFAMAAIHLYGVISLADFAEIFNQHYNENVTPEEVYSLLLPLVRKKRDYWFYKGYLTHYQALHDVQWADYWIREQEGKPRYLPSLEEFLPYEYHFHRSDEENEHWMKIVRLVLANWRQSSNQARFLEELEMIDELGSFTQEFGRIMEKYNYEFKNEAQIHEFMSAIIEFQNHKRLKIHKGHTASEIRVWAQKNRPSVESRSSTASGITVHENKKIGPNEPCYCGSGKKYKKCCRLVESSKSAKLTHDEAKFFYEIWYGLIG